MGNIRKWLENAEQATGERIDAIVVGPHDNRDSKYTDNDKPLPDENVILSRDSGLKKLDQEYNEGFGWADCFPMFAWTRSRVYFISEYDGATGLSWVPRHPIAICPDFSGNQ